MKKINEKYNQADVWPDGSCIKNPGPGGWGAIIQLSMQHDDNNLGTNKDKPFKISGYEAHTTNNRMELTAIIEALLFLQKQNINYEQTQINVYTDSTYLQQGINQWLDKWLRNNWHTSSKEPVKNQDLWQRLHALKHDSIQVFWVKSHAQCKNNKLADDLARAEARNLIKDSQCYQPHKINQDDLDQRALALHAQSPSGKVTTIPSKPVNSSTLPLIYTPGVAAVATLIQNKPHLWRQYTNAGNCIGIISNGTATLGLGNTGHLAVKPVLEGKSNLLYKLTGLDSTDLIINESDINKLTQYIIALADNFAAIVLEDIRAPDCFVLERNLQQKLSIPVIHDDQHGTAVAVLAFLYNALRLTQKPMTQCKVVINGAGAGGLATANLLVGAGFNQKHMILLDSKGVINQHRQDLQHNKWKMAFINHCDFTSLNEIIIDADIFIGLSVANVLTADMVSKMHEQPIILALANPEPEITPAEALKGNPSAIIGTGSSKYYNQVNNMLTLPYLLRLALKLSLQSWSQEIFIKTAQAIADLAKSQDNFDNKHLVPQLLHPDLLEHILNVYID